ncbi:MAG TPA: VWA domain-containing protein, partial [Pyrinomonadaceae bacterium]|nr:VWA domain-containing protein [Pyrinomonadaceae bacterium]
VRTVDHIETLTDFTTDRRKIAFAIDNANGSGDTNLYKALKSSLDALAKETGRRKAVIVLTDGIDTDLSRADRSAASNAQDGAQALAAIKPDTNPTLAAVLNDADRQGVTIYPLALPSGDLRRLAEPSPQQTAIYTSARTRLDTLAARTGGRLHEINRLEDMGRLYAEVAAEMRTLYSIVYQSTGSQKRSGQWRAIQIQVARPELIARTRPGYYAR